MIGVTADWNPKQARLKKIAKDRAAFPETIGLCLELHGLVHFSEVTRHQLVHLNDCARIRRKIGKPL